MDKTTTEVTKATPHTVPPNTIIQTVKFYSPDTMPSATHTTQCLLLKHIKVKRIQFNLVYKEATREELTRVRATLHNAMYKIRKVATKTATDKPRKSILMGIHIVAESKVLQVKFFASQVELSVWRAAMSQALTFEPQQPIPLDDSVFDAPAEAETNG